MRKYRDAWNRYLRDKTIGRVLGVFHASEKAHRRDLVDIVDVLAGLGCRIGELLALDWSTSVDFAAGTVRLPGTVIRVTGQGLFVQDHTKSRVACARSDRVGPGDPQAALRGVRLAVGLPLGNRRVAGTRTTRGPGSVPWSRTRPSGDCTRTTSSSGGGEH